MIDSEEDMPVSVVKMLVQDEPVSSNRQQQGVKWEPDVESGAPLQLYWVAVLYLWILSEM